MHPGPGIRRLLHGELTIDRGDGEPHTYRAGRVVVRGRGRPGARDRVRDRGHGVRPRAAAAGRVGGAADDPLRRSGRRGQAEGSSARPSSSRCRCCEDRRPDPRRPARAERRRPRVLRPRRELPARARRALRLADPARHVPPRAGRREHGGGVREADRPAGDLPRHARAGRDAGGGRRPHREAGLDADDPPRRPGAARVSRPRGVAGARLRAGLRRHREGGVGGRQRRADPRAHRRGVLARALGAARAGRARAARGRARRGGRRRRRALASSSRASRRRRGSRRGCASCSPAPSVRSSSSARAAGRRRRAATCRRSARRTRSRSRARFAARTSSTTARRATSACSASRWTRRSPRGCATPTSCSRSAAGSARCRRAATRSSSRRDPRQTLVHVHPDPGELGRVYEPDLAIVATLPEFAAALRALDPVEPRWREWTAAARADYEANLRARADGGRRRPRRGHGVPPRAASRRRGPDVRRRQLHRLGAPLRRVHAVRHAGVPAQRLDGLRRSRPRSPRSSSTRSASSSASRATATS